MADHGCMRDVKVPTLTELRLLAVVGDAHSLSGAAKRLGISQPAVSQRARELEKKCGCTLFDRGVYTTCLTSNGERIANQAQRVLDEYERLLSLIVELANEGEAIRT